MSRTCVNCGADLPTETQISANLVALGYLHEDVHVDCGECGESHTFGIPRERETTEPPHCNCCGGREYPYKVDAYTMRDRMDSWGSKGYTYNVKDIEEILKRIEIHWKCEDCWHFRKGTLDHLVNDVWLLGVDHLVGRRDDDDG